MAVKLSNFICPIFLVSTLIIWGSSYNIDEHENWKYLPEECGFGNSADRIIGGVEASLGQFPWMARLAYQNGNNRSNYVFGCGGAILNHWFIITAAHCIVGSLRTRLLFVRVGENYADEDIDCEDDVCAPRPQDISWKNIIKHRFYPNIEGMTVIGDIALIRLKNPIRFNDFVQPICLPTSVIVDNSADLLKEGELVEVAGWGAVNSITLAAADKLMYVQLEIETLEQCQEVYDDEIDDTQICIGKEKGKDTCVGDSGGPVMKPFSIDGPPKYFLVAIVSYGVKWCGTAGAVYTNVSHYMEWILDRIDQ
ncbi:hypothetical protein GWI33_019111 [Rhynchophorus ferrugineus]|uniref:Peptidase S1 domain-containing protein n=1 Tax=Rhynchophorus ferrugineus TaxID=354439 RepID=A0A834HUY5_RHYFE|nr:hypothetical protein GWI33_019111 [Rhynchophorus ferrugineus]